MNITRTLPRCPPGYYYAAQPPPGKESDRGWCYKCLAGTYSDERNRDAQCKSCRVCSQELGLIEMQPCRPISDTLCRCRDRYVLEHGRCQPIEVHFSHGTTIEAEKELLNGATARSARIPRPHIATIAPVEVDETNSMSDPAAAESAKSIHSKTIEPQALRTSGTRWFLERHEAGHVETTMLPGTENHTEIQPESVAFFFGSIPVTTAVVTMGIVSFVSIAALAAVALTLCVKRRQRNNGGKRQSVEVSLESDYHVYEDPETLIPDILPPLRIRVVAAASVAPGCAASQSLDGPSSPIASENSFAPLLGGDQTSAGDDEPSAYCDVEHSHAPIHEESNLSKCLIARWPVTGASSSGGSGGGVEAHVLRNNFFASEICGSADGAASRSAAAADMIGAATASCIELPASDERRPEGGSSHRSECASNTKAGAIAAEGLRDGGYIYSREWGQLLHSIRRE